VLAIASCRETDPFCHVGVSGVFLVTYRLCWSPSTGGAAANGAVYYRSTEKNPW
jgi:hypothetical protein